MPRKILKNIVKHSRSYRRFFEGHKISRNTLVQLVDLARFSPSMRNQQALKFILSHKAATNDIVFPALAWAGALKKWDGPEAGERPSAYIVILGDTRISRDFGPDHGIAAQSILLGAVERKLGGCMIGSINRGLLRRKVGVPSHFNILLVIALGKPREKIILEKTKRNGRTTYYRDRKGYHHVPKRRLEEIIIG